jgi:hypothetical protein
VGEAGGITGNDADTGAAVTTAGDLFDATIVKARRGIRLVFGVHLREVGAGAHSSGEYSFQDICVDHNPQDTTWEVWATLVQPRRST